MPTFFYLAFLMHIIGASNGEEETKSKIPGNLRGEFGFNLTIDHLSPRSVFLSWNCLRHNYNEKYEVTLKPIGARYRVIETVPNNNCFLSVDNLQPGLSYSVSVVGIVGRERYRSKSVVFQTYREADYSDEPGILNGMMESTGLKFPKVRLVEIALVAMALILWAGAIVLFFHRWGKIRMLLPYQPDYKEMKQTSSTCTNCSITPHHQCTRLQCPGLQIPGEFIGPGGATCELLRIPVTDIGCSPIYSRPRLNSFIGYNISEIQQSEPRQCRKSKSAENIPLSHLDPTFTTFTTDFGV